MRHCFAVILCLLTAQVSAYTIDFEEFAPGETAGPVTPLVSGEYEIRADYQCDTPPVNCGAQVTAGNTFSVFGDQYFFDIYAEFDISRSDGGVFAVHSMDLLLDTGVGRLTGTTAGGASITGTLADLGQGDWLNLVSFGYYSSNPGGTPIPAIIEVDNIILEAVPIPASVWLFGSALAGLGWLRRRQTV